jgi:hypothetical protein
LQYNADQTCWFITGYDAILGSLTLNGANSLAITNSSGVPSIINSAIYSVFGSPSGSGDIGPISLAPDTVLARVGFGDLSALSISSLGSTSFSSVVFTSSAITAAERYKINRWVGPVTQLSLPTNPADGEEIGFFSVDDGVLTNGACGLSTAHAFFESGGPTSITLRRPFAIPYGPLYMFKFSSAVNAWLLINGNLTYTLAAAANQILISDTGLTAVGSPIVQPITVGTNSLIGRGASGNITSIEIDDINLGWGPTVFSGSGAFTLIANRINPYDAGAGGIALNLPNSPTDGMRCATKEIAGSASAVLVQTLSGNLENDAGAMVTSFNVTGAREYREFIFRTSVGWLQVG